MWTLKGYDAFEEEYYSLLGYWFIEAEAKQAAFEELQKIMGSQPTEDTGGQQDEEIQDRVFIVRPDGTQYRYIVVEAA